MPATPAEAEDCARQREALVRDGFRAETAAGPTGAGVLVPGDGALDPLARCRVLAARARAAGAQLFTGSPVQTLAGDRVVTPSGAVRCRAVVVAVDGGLETLAARARAARALDAAADARHRAGGAGAVPAPRLRQLGLRLLAAAPDGRIALGGGRDRFRDAEWGRPAEPTRWCRRGSTGCCASAGHRRGRDAPVGGVVAYTDDGLPVLEEVRPGVIASGALCGHGNVLGSAAARAATAIALGEPVPPLARHLRPEVWG